MRRKISLLALSLVLATATFGSEATPLIRKRVSEVQLTVVATDRNERPMPGLSPADITVLEDGRPIPHFELRSAADLPLRLGIVLDLSDSTQKSWAAVRSALIRSLQEVIRPGDEILLLAFSSKIEMERTLTEPGQLDGAPQTPVSGGLTALYDSIYKTCEHNIFGADTEPHRSALILFSDGEDDLSRHGLGEVIAKAQLRGIAIYALSNHNPKIKKQGDFVLRDLAAATGGRDFVVKDTRHLQDALSAINGELRSSYLLFYRPPAESETPTFRRVYVVPTQSNGSHVRSRAGYFTAP